MLFSHGEAKQEATSLIKKYHTSNPYKLIKACDYDLIYIDLPGRTLGQTVRSSRCCTVFIDNHLTLNVRTFVLAHELGHCRLHEGFSTPFFNKIVNTQKERQANEFALTLLLFGVEDEDLLQEHNKYRLLDYLGLPYDFERFFC